MKKKVFSLMMTLVFAFMGLAQAQVYELTDGSTTTNTSLPTSSFYKNVLSQQIYTAEELGPAGNITSIAFYNGGTTKTRKIDVYMVLTDKEAFESNTDWIVPTAANKVYSDTALVFTANEWTTLTLTAPVAYDGTQNVAIIVHDYTGSYSSGLACRSLDGPSQAIYVRSDGTQYNPLNPVTDPTATTPVYYSGTLMDVKNQVRFGGLQGPPMSVDLPTNSYYKFTLSQQLILPTDLDGLAELGAISFYNKGEVMTRNLDVYMTLVDTTGFTGVFADSLDWVAVDSTDLVFSGEVTFARYDWTKIVFDTAFAYDGYSLVILTVDDNTDVAVEGLNFLMEEMDTTFAMYYHSDDSTRINPNPMTMAEPGVPTNLRNVMTFDSYMYELTVADSTATNGFLPVYGFYADAYNKAEYVIPAEELASMGNASITGLKYYASQTNVSWGSASFQVFLKEVPETEISDFSGVTGATVVYEGSLSIVNGEMVINFTTPYAYQGGNLLVGVYQTATGSYVTSTWYGKNVTGASVQGYSYSSLGAISATQRNFIPKTTISYAPGLVPPVVIDPDLYILENSANLTPITTLDLGYRPNGAWMRPASWYLYNMTRHDATVRDYDFTPNPDFFDLVAPEVPFTLAADDSIQLSFTTADSIAAGVVNRQFAIMYDTRAAGVWDITATAYDPIENDVYELATELDMDDMPYVDTLFVMLNDTTRWLYDNYVLAPDTVEDGNDAVYKLTFDNDVLFNAYAYGENAKLALYAEDFNFAEYGIPGPDVENTYNGPVIGGGSAASTADYDVVVGDSTGTQSYHPYYTLFNHSISEQLFLAAELTEAGMSAGIVSQIGFKCTNSYGNLDENIKIWMGNVTIDEMTSTTLQTNDMTLVYDGDIETVQGWNMLDIEAAGFEWDGVSNIVIATQRMDDSWHSSTYFVAHNTSFTSAVYKYSDTEEYDIASQTYTGSTAMRRAQTRFVSGTPNNRANVANAPRRNRDEVVIEQGFEDGMGDWTMNNCHSSSGVSSSYGGNTGDYAFRFYYTANYPQYLISPELDDNDGVNLTFYAARYSSNYPETFKVGYSSTTNEPTEFTWGSEVTCTTIYGAGAYEEYSYDFPAGTKYVSIACTSNDQFYLFVDDITITVEEASGGGDEPEPEPYVVNTVMDFSDGMIPADWTAECDYDEWYVDTIATGGQAAFNGMSLFMDGQANGEALYYATYNFEGQGTMRFNYIAKGGSTLDVVYGESTANLHTLASGLNSNTWKEFEVDLSELGETRGQYIIGFRSNGATGGVVGLDNIFINLYGNPDAAIEDLTVVAGTYYLVVSSTADSTFMVNICPREIPCPLQAYNPSPADDADGLEPRRVDLTWELGEYTTEYRLVFGTTYYCEETLVDWTSDLAQSYTVRNLFNNTNYFWRVDERNGGENGCVTLGEVWGFTTHLNVPQNLRFEDESIFVGEDAVVIWDNIEDRTFRMYNIYVDGVYVGSTPETYNPSAFLSYAIDSLGYNMNPGYRIQVSALYDEGESALSEPVMAKVSGYGTLAGHVWEQDGTTGIANADIYIVGYNEFNEVFVDTVHTNANGAYSIVVPVSSTTMPQGTTVMPQGSYILMAHKDGYQGYPSPIQGNPRFVVYNHSTQADFILDEEFYPVGNVWAEYYPDPEEDDEYVKVYWTMSGNMSGGELTVCDGTSTSSYVPLYGLWVDDYTRTECVYPADMLAPLAGTQISSLKYYISSPATGDFGAASFNVYLMEVPNTAISSYYGSDNATVVYSGSLDATGTEMMINFTTPYTYNGGNLLIGIEEPTTGTYHSAYFYGVESTGSSASGYNSGSLANVTFYQRNFLPKVTFNSGRSTAAADRSFHHYRIYRTSCYNDGPYNSDNTVMLASDWPTDTVYIDTNFDTVSPGVYKWGVSCIYQGNRSTDYPNPNDRESEIVWSNCLDKDMYLEPYLVDVNVILNSADSPEGTRVTFVNQNEIEQELYPVAPVILDESGFFAFESFRRGTYEVTVSKAGFESESEIVEIWGETHLRYVLTEIIYGVQNVYVSRTGWAMWEPMAPSGGGAGDLITFETGDFSEYSFDNGVSSYPWAVTNSQAYEGSYCMMSTNGGVASSASAIQATVNYSAPGTVEFAALCMGEGTSTYWDKCQFFIDGVEQFSCGANVAGWNEYSFDVASGSHTFKWSYTKDGSVNPTGDAMFVDNVRFTGGRSNDRHLEGYKVMCTSVDGVPIFTNNTIYPEPFCQLTTVDPNTGLAFLEEGEIYIVKVCAIYSTGQSDWTSAAFQYEPCDHWGPVDFVDVSTDVVGNYLEWSFENGYNPYDPGSGPTPGPGTNSFTDDFESGLGNWTLIDADGDGNNWYHSSQSMTYSCYDYTGWGHNTSDGFAVSQSYTDCTYDSYDPNNFMVTNQKYAIVAGSTLTFWADYGNDSYPDHFGVAVATADNPGASDFTMVWEGSAKGGNGKSAVRHNDNRYMNWRQHTVDLSAYAGQEVYIAFRHFNSYDQYEIYIDDVTLSAGAKGGETAYYGGNDLESGMLATGIYAFNVTDIENFDERVYTVANLLKDDRFEVVVDKNNSVLLVNTGKYHESEDLEANFNAFRAEMAEEFAAMDKETASETAMTLKSEMTYDMVNALMMDIYARSRENNLCSLADPFCTDNGMYEFPAGVNAGSGEPGPDYNCLYTQPNPAWYYMRIGEPGGIDIYMYSTPSVDIDFCCWGPFDDPVSPCPYGLTGDKVVSCSYSIAPTEHCMIPNNAQVGEYYILVITNYSNQTCNINFSAVGGAGSTDCGILPPVDIIGFLITMDGEYLDIVGPTVRDYTHYGEYGEHEYCVRPIYPGTMELPSDNFGWSMGCPVCGISGGEMHCEPGSPITGAYYYENGEDFGAILNWEGEIVPPTPVEGDEFTVDLDGGMPAGWTTIDADGDGYDWVLGSACGGIYLVAGSSLAGAGHNSSADLIVSGSYSNVVGALTPDNFLVSPEVTLGNSSIFSFWACAQDAGYAAEHFGVAVSTDGINYDMVQEWTMTAKAGAKAGRGQNAQGTWHQYSVDLSAYAGEQAYIAIRHFNCTDMFMLDVDDIELSNGAKRNRAEIIAYNIYRSTDNIDYSLIGTVPAEEGVELYQYIDQTTPGTYYYQVTAVYSNGCESEGALNAENLDEDFVTVVVTGVEDNMGKVALYPNPTNGLVKIEARDMTHITVVSVVGQVVYDSNVSGDEFEINMAQWNAGVYVVRIATENGVSTQRVTVVK